MAVELKEKFPEIVFAIAGGTHVAPKFYREQKDIEYQIFEPDDMGIDKKDTDFDELKRFENELPLKSLWRLISADRKLGRSFLSGVSGYEYKFKNDRDIILNIAYNKINELNIIFDEFKPDLFIPAICNGGISVSIFDHLCNEKDIPYAVIQTCRVQNLFAFSSDKLLRFPNIDKTAKMFFQKKISIDLSMAEKLYNDIMSDLDDPDYFDLKNTRMQKVELTKTWSRIKYFYIIIPGVVVLGILDEIRNYIFRIYKTKSLYNHDSPSLLQRFRSIILKGIQKSRLSKPSFGEILPPDQKYLYYPLHTNPEYSTLIQGTMWQDQLMVVEILAKSIPSDWVVYVKEHPATVRFRTRPLSFYKRLKEFPNVVLAPTYMDMNSIISKSEMVAVITGTTGWEAILRGKPVINFSDHMFDAIGLSIKCTNIEKLSVDIFNEVNRIKKILPAERKRRIVCLLASMLKYGFRITYPKQLFYIEYANDEEHEVCGKELAEGLIKHLGYLEKEMGYDFGIHS